MFQTYRDCLLNFSPCISGTTNELEHLLVGYYLPAVKLEEQHSVWIKS